MSDFQSYEVKLEELKSKISSFENAQHIDFTVFPAREIARLDISGLNVSFSVFRGMELAGLSGQGADLSGVCFERANLTAAKLSGANLRGADFTGTNLNAADLTGADLRGARFVGANLTSADFSKAQIAGAHFESCVGLDNNTLPSSLLHSQSNQYPEVVRSAKRRNHLIGGSAVVLSLSLIVSGMLSDPQRKQAEVIRQAQAQAEQILAEAAREAEQVSSEAAAEAQEAQAELDWALQQLEKVRAENPAKTTPEPISLQQKRDIAGSFKVLLDGRPESVEKYVIYFDQLAEIEEDHGPGVRREVAEMTAEMHKSGSNPGFVALLLAGGEFAGEITRSQVEQLLEERYSYLERTSGQGNFWGQDVNWSNYWNSRLEELGLLR